MPPSRPGRGRMLTRSLAVVAALIVLVGIFVLWYFRRSLPVIDGEQHVAGLSAPIDIIRDADAIPHIFASSKDDALFGLGYAHAQDRLWQMELQRRIGFGRLSEIFGAVSVPQDRFLRTVGFGRAARAAWERLAPSVKEEVDAYAAGINAFVSTHHGRQLPPEFSLLRFEPAPWTGPDIVVWQKMLAWDLSTNYALELFRDDLVRAVGEDRMRQLMPPYAEDGLSILGAEGIPRLSAELSTRTSTKISSNSSTTEDTEEGRTETFPSVSSASSAVARSSGLAVVESLSSAASFRAALSSGLPAVRDLLLGGAATEAVGSNNWVVDGTLTASGSPLLANDPHLGTRIPSTWYLAHMSAGTFDVAGATLPGTPVVALGRNRSIAWGATNALADVEDLYRERIDASGRFAEFRGAEEPISIVSETIDVRGAAPVHVDVRVTRHGPLVSDAINANNAAAPVVPGRPGPARLEPLSFRWTALDPDDRTLSAFLKLNEAHDWNSFTSALCDFVAPSQNFVYADTAGRIGYYMPGRVPLRANGDGSRPVDGWTGEHEWTGWIPFDSLPHMFDPPAHFIVTANNRQEPPGYPFDLGMDWQEPLRAARITELLRAGTRFTPDDFARIQADTLSLQARILLPRFLAHVPAPADADRQAVAMLRAWDGDARGDSGGAALFEAWLQHIVPAIAGDDLGVPLVTDYQDRFSSVSRFLVRTLDTNDERWCDDAGTSLLETCDQTVASALHAAVADLTARLGGDLARWRWDGVHRAIFPHQGLDAVALLRPLLSRSVPNGGDWSTVNVGVVAPDRPYQQRSVAGFREIIDLSPAGASRVMIDVGESGHPLSPYYSDFLPDWQRVRYRRLRMERADIENGALGRLHLTPK